MVLVSRVVRDEVDPHTLIRSHRRTPQQPRHDNYARRPGQHHPKENCLYGRHQRPRATIDFPILLGIELSTSKKILQGTRRVG